MDTVAMLLERKGATVQTCHPEDEVAAAARRMMTAGIGALVVCDHQHVVGIISERDIIRRIGIDDARALRETVATVMTKPVHCVGPHDTLDRCMALMTDRRCRHLPVLVDSVLVGIVSIGDMVKAQLDHQAFVIDQLETYIAGSGV